MLLLKTTQHVVTCLTRKPVSRSYFTALDRVANVAQVKISKIFNIPSVRILLFLALKGEVRHSQLTVLIRSRGALSNAIRELRDEKLIQRRVEDSIPIQSFYSLTRKGKELPKRH